MAATKARTSLWSGTSLVASTPATSSTIDLSAGYGAQLNLKITNGGTGPTLPAQFQIQVANDAAGTLFVDFGGPLVAALGNSVATSWSIDLPIGVAAVKVIGSGNTAQNVTMDGDIANVTVV